MFDNEDSPLDMSQRSVREAKSPVPKSDLPPSPKKMKGKDLDSEEMLEIHGRLMAIYRRELDRQMQNRAEMGIDADFYDNIQWDEKDMQTLRDRGQYPLVYNVISTAINWVTGTEKRSRMDYKILPRRK